MADVVQELVIALGLDSSNLMGGIDKAVAAVGDAVGSTTAKTSAASKEAAKSLEEVGQKGEAAARKTGEAFKAILPVFQNLRTAALGLVGALIGAGTAGKLFSKYIDEGDKLTKLAQQTGISARKLDAWGKANEAAGGSAEALQNSLKAFYDSTGRPAQEFFKLGEKIEGMSKRQAQAFLRAQGVAWDAIPVFLNGQKAADQLVSKYRRIAFTAQDARNASNFKTAWMDFRVAVQAVGNTFLRMLVPAMTKVLDVLSEMVRYVLDNIQFFTIFGGVLAAVFAVKNIEAVKAAALAVKAFGVSVKGALLPLTAIAVGVGIVAAALDDLITFARGGDSIFGTLLEKFGMAPDEIREIQDALNTVGDAFKSLFKAVEPMLRGILTLGAKIISVAIVPVISLLAAVVAGIVKVSQWATKAGEAIIDAFSEAKETVSGFFGAIGETLVGAFGTAVDAVRSFFASWYDIFLSLVIEPIKKSFKGLFGGLKAFFGFSSDDGEKTAAPNQVPVSRQAQDVMERRSQTPQGTQVETNATVNVTNNIQTRDNPKAVGEAVGRSVEGGAERVGNLTSQSMRGVFLK